MVCQLSRSKLGILIMKIGSIDQAGGGAPGFSEPPACGRPHVHGIDRSIDPPYPYPCVRKLHMHI